MTKAELIEHMSERFDIGEDVAQEVVREIVGAMALAMSEGRRIEIRGFGSFDLALVRARIGRNPKTGESVSVPAKKRPRFKTGKDLRDILNVVGRR
jgi:integration host factor subunit beta